MIKACESVEAFLDITHKHSYSLNPAFRHGFFDKFYFFDDWEVQKKVCYDFIIYLYLTHNCSDLILSITHSKHFLYTYICI